MMKPIFIDFETYSSEDIKSGGAYRYTQSPDFEILLIGYAVGNGAVHIVDMTRSDAYDQVPYHVSRTHRRIYS